MKSLSFRIPAALYEELMASDSREIDDMLENLEIVIRNRVRMIVRKQFPNERYYRARQQRIANRAANEIRTLVSREQDRLVTA